jgi:NADH:ubiquinone oxidoreductase subunit 3 (subunit A)
MQAAGYGPGHMLSLFGIFFALLLIGFVYEWRRGVFKWN